MRILYFILVIVFALFIVTFSQQNLESIQLKYYDYLKHVPPVPVYLLIFISFIVGVIVTPINKTIIPKARVFTNHSFFIIYLPLLQIIKQVIAYKVLHNNCINNL